MITVSALPNAPDFAKGNVRDLRVRWALEEVGLPYGVRLVSPEARASAEYRALQPFGQVPAIEWDGVRMFESAAIVLHVAERGRRLLPREPEKRAQAMSWLFAAVSTIEPCVMNLAEVDFFLSDEKTMRERRPIVLEFLDLRLRELALALDGRDHLVGEFGIADLMMSSALRILKHADILAAHPTLAAYRRRCEARPAFQRALDAQLADFQHAA